MAQVSYGTITITDTNDIESIIIEYARNQSTSSAPDSQTGGWSTTRPAWAQGYYIWQRARIHKSGTDASEDEFGTAVCITGSTGQTGAAGRGLTATETKYTNVASGTTQAQVEALAESAWVNSVPSYNSSKPDYWVRIKNTYDKAPTTEYIYYKDNAVGDALAAAAMANSLAQSANENANGAMGQAASNVNSIVRLWRAKSERSIPSAPTSEITTGSTSEYTNWSTIKPTATDTYRYFYYCDQSKTGGGVCTWSEVIEDTSYLSTYEINSLNVRTKNFFKGLDNSYDGWFASGRAENEGLVTNNAETYHYNARFAATHIALGYNKTPIIDLDGGSGAINIYRFPTINSNTGLVTTAGALGMKLSATDLIFYKPPVGNNSPVAAATLNANGLVLSEGGIVAGTKGQTGYIYLSTVNHPVGTNGITINGFTPTSSTEQWREVIGTKFGVTNAGTLYANNAVISGTITVGSGSTIDSGATIGGTSASTVVSNAATGAQASSDLSNFQTTVANTYATQSALSDVEGQIPSDINELSDTDGIIPNDLSQLTDTTNIISGAVSTGVAGKADKTEAVYRTQRIYRRYTAAQSSLNGPTTWVTNNTDIYNDWTTKIPPLTNNGTKYPYLYTCTQKQTVTQYNGGSGTECISTTVLLDDTTTIIDGGSIIAGSVTANEITGSKLSAIYADMGNITAGNITKGYNSINFDNSPATLEFKNNSTWANATKGIQWTGSDLNIKGNITATSLIIDSGATVSGVVVPSQIANMATQADVAGASYSVEIQVSSIDYTTYSATLVAVPYYKGVKLTNSTTPSLSSITYQWYKNGVALSNTGSGVTPSISGVTTSTLELGSGTDFGTDGTNPTYALYTCVISN